jgi:hypothetical protein
MSATNEPVSIFLDIAVSMPPSAFPNDRLNGWAASDNRAVSPLLIR